MENQSNKENWENLARELGAEAPQSTADVGESSAESGSADAPLPRRVVLPVEPPRSAPAGWDLLASEFGIESPAELSAERDMMHESQSGVEFSNYLADDERDSPAGSNAVEFGDENRDPLAVDEDPAESGSGPASVQLSTHDADVETTEPKFAGSGWGMGDDIIDESNDREGSEEDFVRTDLVAGVDMTAADEPDQIDVEPIAETRPEVAPTEHTDSAAPKPALSFWESIFGPREEAASSTPLSDVPPQRADVDDQAGAPVGDSAIDTPSEEGLAEEEERPRRRSRRGRRGRGRTRTDEQTRHEGETDVPTADRKRVTPVSDADRSVDDFPAEKAKPPRQDRDRLGRAKPASHRNLPSWDDAIGVIVESNLASRAEHRRSTARSSGRGRPRGRRKKKS